MKKLLLLVLIAIMWFGFWSYRYSQQKKDLNSTGQKSSISKVSSQQNQIKKEASRQMMEDQKEASKANDSKIIDKFKAKKLDQNNTKKSKPNNSLNSNNSKVVKNQVSYNGAKVRGDYIDLFFEANEYADLDQELIEYIGELVDDLKGQKCKVVVSGHTDDKGGTHTNFLQGLNRARLISKLLQQKGLKKEDILTNSYGEHAPLVKSNSPENLIKNNRVEILIAR